jgi:hypothetical protein
MLEDLSLRGGDDGCRRHRLSRMKGFMVRHYALTDMKLL